MKISPSFLSCDFSKLNEEIKSVSRAEWLHFDVMDGAFVPNRTYGPEMLGMVKGFSTQFFDCHLMIENPFEKAQDYIFSGADLVTFHLEAEPARAKETIDLIHSVGCLVGISVKPATDVLLLEPYLAFVDLVLVMSVEPGKGGQAFLPESIEKIRWLDGERRANGHRYLIEVDGGINQDTIALVKEAGADISVVGSFLFSQKDRNGMIEVLERD